MLFQSVLRFLFSTYHMAFVALYNFVFLSVLFAFLVQFFGLCLVYDVVVLISVNEKKYHFDL